MIKAKYGIHNANIGRAEKFAAQIEVSKDAIAHYRGEGTLQKRTWNRLYDMAMEEFTNFKRSFTALEQGRMALGYFVEEEIDPWEEYVTGKTNIRPVYGEHVMQYRLTAYVIDLEARLP